MLIAQILHDRAHWIFEADKMPNWPPTPDGKPIELIDVTGKDVKEGYLYDRDTNTFIAPPPMPEPIEPPEELPEPLTTTEQAILDTAVNMEWRMLWQSSIKEHDVVPKNTMQKITGAETSQPQHYNRNKIWTKPFISAIIIVFILGIISLFTGVYDIRGQEDGINMFFITRVPRTASLMLTGAAMSMAGLVTQLITQNRLVEPTTTGTIEWAGLGLIFVYLVFPAPTLVLRMTGAIIFSFIGTMVFFLFLRRVKLRSSLIVPIIGMMLGAVISAISTFIGLVFKMTQNIETWFVGSFAPVQIGRYEYLWLIVVVTFLIFIYADRLTLAGLGEDIATSLGVNYNKIVLLGTGLISFAVGIVAAVIGNLPFLGLIVPNIVSMYRGDDLRGNLPWVCVLGMGTITLCDIISRTIIMPFEVPVSLILGTVGAVIFILILLKQRRLR